MKKILFVIAFLFLYVGINYSQVTNLYCVDYAGTDKRDTIAVNGSTNAGSGWFTTNTGYDYYLSIHNGSKWFVYKLSPLAGLSTKLSVYMWGADTTIGVYGYFNGLSQLIPFEQESAPTTLTGTTHFLKLGVTTQYFVEFFSVSRAKSRD